MSIENIYKYTSDAIFGEWSDFFGSYGEHIVITHKTEPAPAQHAKLRTTRKAELLEDAI